MEVKNENEKVKEVINEVCVNKSEELIQYPGPSKIVSEKSKKSVEDIIEHSDSDCSDIYPLRTNKEVSKR